MLGTGGGAGDCQEECFVSVQKSKGDKRDCVRLNGITLLTVLGKLPEGQSSSIYSKD